MANCKGCGITLQYDDPSAPGYTPKKDSEYCQRCFRLMHYDDLTVSMRKGIDPDTVLDRIASMNALVLWVVDLFDFEASLIPSLNRRINTDDIIMVAAKRDILPDTLNHEKVARFVFARLKEEGIHIKGLILTSRLHGQGVQEIKDAVNMYAHGRDVVVMGRANAGKSTLLNNMLGKTLLTSSRYPGTTLDFNRLEIDGQTYIDTPGIEITGSILMDVREEDLKIILPARTIKPQIYQVNRDQSFIIGGLARFDVLGCDHATAVFYLSDGLGIHRCKADHAQELFEKHYGELFVPVPLQKKFRTVSSGKHMAKMDAVIGGLGWMCVSGQMDGVRVMAPDDVNVTFRKAML